MAITINIYYRGKNGNAKKQDDETVLLIDSWQNQEAIDLHHHSPMMQKITQLRDKYDLHMRVERYISDELPQADKKYIKN
ncbi:MAG: antibiotic biosynthesis monooxygenase [Lachnoclostridium sp.]|nr:antibiotic biosynthesis monooxygenase [Lachnoclostridium sp.]